jgi:drug/metabolite transporter (DMT)-like permease
MEQNVSSEKSGAARAAAPATWLVGVCLFCVYVIWGTTYFALKVGLEGAGPYFLIGTRFLAAGLPLMAWLRFRGHPLPSLRQWRGATIIAFLLLIVSLGNVTVAEKWVSSGAAATLISLLPLVVALWSVAFGHRPRPLEWVAIGMGFAGTIVIVTGHELRANAQGTVLILIGISAWSLGSLLSRRIETPPGAMGFAAEMLAGGAMALLLSLLFRESWTLPHASRVWWAWGYLVVFGSLIAFSAYRFLVEHVAPTLAATYAYVNPPVALLVGWALGNESFSANVLLGLPIVLASVGLLAWAQIRGSRAPRTQRAPTAATGVVQ